MRLLSLLKIILFVVLLIQPISICLSFAELPPSKLGGRIVLSTTTDPKSFNDMVAKETSTTMITGFLFEGLTRLNVQSLKVEPNLADHWTISKDGLIWTFYLRKNLRWSDGVPLTADDVMFTFNDLIYNPDVANSSRDVFTVDGKEFKVDKVDDYTVRFTLPVKFAPFLKGMSQSILPKHKLAEAVKQKKFNYTWGIDTPPHEIVGQGPFILDAYHPGERVVLKRNPYYWRTAENADRLPYLDEVLILIVPNSDVELLKFMEGSLDYYDLRGMDYPLLKPLESFKNFTIYNLGPTMGSSFLVFNLNTGINKKIQKPYVSPVKMAWFNDIEFRKAIAYAIDRDQMAKIVFNGLAYPQFSSISPADVFFYNPKVIRYEYDLQRARAILSKAGYLDRNGDGIIEDIQGNRIQFNIATNADSAERMDIAAIIRQDLERLGMDVRLVPMEFNTLVGKLTGTFEWDAIVLSLTGTIEPHFGKNVWSSNGQLHMWNPRQEAPVTDWEKRIDDLFSKGVQELDENKRKIIYDEFQMIVSQKLPVIYTVLSARIAGIRNKFGNLKPSSYGGLLHNIEEIYILK